MKFSFFSFFFFWFPVFSDFSFLPSRYDRNTFFFYWPLFRRTKFRSGGNFKFITVNQSLWLSFFSFRLNSASQENPTENRVRNQNPFIVSYHFIITCSPRMGSPPPPPSFKKNWKNREKRRKRRMSRYPRTMDEI